MRFSPEYTAQNSSPEDSEIQKSDLPDDQISAHEKQDYNREKLTGILTGHDPHKKILALAKSGTLRMLLEEVDDLRGVRHTVPGHQARFHREGDVFRHTLNVLRAPSLPEISDLIRDTYASIDSLTTDNEMSEAFFSKTSPELAWSLLLHDIGKQQTQKVALDHAGNVVGHYSFHDHGPQAAETFRTTIAKRFHFSEDQIEKIATLIEDHMLMHKLMRGKDHLTKDELNFMMHHPLKEELLWHALFDAVGNYTSRDNRQETVKATVSQKIRDFKEAWETLIQSD